MKTVMNHSQDGGLLKMISRTDPVISVEDGETISSWGFKETTAFNTYYAATHYRSYSQIMKVERTTKLSAHNLFYLILKDMGKSDEEVRRIMGISPEGLRSLRSRTKPKGKE